jgi:hypothetical protein
MWINIDKNREISRAAIDEIDNTASDRVAAIVGAAFVEDHVNEFVRWHLVQEPKLLDELFRVTGPLGNFSVKVDMGYLMRLYSKDAWKELDTITKIRNAFAHKMEVRDFKDDRMRAFANNLTLWERKIIRITAPRGTSEGAIVSMTFGGSKGLRLLDPVPNGVKLTPRERFINACKFYVAAFAILIHKSQKHDDPLF